MRYPYQGNTDYLQFAIDDQGRRTDTWLQSLQNHTKWMAHSRTSYDASGRVSAVTADQGTGDANYKRVMDLTYCYAAGSTAPTCAATASSDRTKLAWTRDGVTGDVTAYTYDTSGRLTKAATTGPNAITYTYTYDANGNRLTAGTGGSTTTSTYNQGNQLTTTGTSYDGAGNLTAGGAVTGITYNGNDQLTAVTKGGTAYTYKHAGTNQHEVTHADAPSGAKYDLTYGRTDAQGLPIIEQVKVTNSNNQAVTAYIEHDPVTGAPLLLRTSSGMQSLYVYDGTGNPITLITSAGYQAYAYKFDPYGTAVVTTNSGGLGLGQNPYTFKGGLQDRVTGWVKFGQRWYDPTTGRFTQQDTVDAPLDPGNANRYAYAADDPINLLDPTGQGACTNALVGGALSAVGFFGGTVALFGAPLTGGASTVLAIGLYEASAAGLAYGAAGVSDTC